MDATITLANYPLDEAIQGGIDRLIREKLEELDEKIDALVADALVERLKALTEDALRQKFEAVLAAGWPMTNNYGEPTGKVYTLEQKVLSFLKADSDYHSPLNTIFRGELEKAMKGELGALIKEATERLKSMLNSSIEEKLRGAVKDAFR